MVTSTVVRGSAAVRLVLAGVWLTACTYSADGTGAPDASAREAVVSLLDDGRQSELLLETFSVLSRSSVRSAADSAFELVFAAGARFSNAGYFAGPSVLEKRISVTRTPPDSLNRDYWHAARRGDHLVLAGTLRFYRRGGSWVFAPTLSDVRVLHIQRADL